ncbi:hypothetical protein R6Q59_001912 [Mikania micrantha]
MVFGINAVIMNYATIFFKGAMHTQDAEYEPWQNAHKSENLISENLWDLVGIKGKFGLNFYRKLGTTLPEGLDGLKALSLHLTSPCLIA